MKRPLAFSLVTLLQVSVVLSAQQSANVNGIIVDPRGGAIRGARISAVAAGTQIHAEAVSGGDGRFRLTLPPGHYAISVTSSSFARAEREVDLAAGATQELRIQMQLAPLAATVQVTAQTTPAEVVSSPAPVDVLTREEIDHRAATSLPDLLATQPGFSLAQTGAEGGLTTLFLDGGDSNHARVLLDGAPANDSGGEMDFSNMTLDNIAKVEIVHGAESALYGSDALDGVVQLFTRRGSTRQPELDLTAEGGSFSTGRGEADLSGLIGKFDYSASFGYFSTQGQGPNDFFLNRTYSGNFGYAFNDANALRLVLRANTSDAGLPGPTLFIPANLTQFYARRDFLASLTWNGQSGPHWLWRVAATEATPRWVDNNAPTFVSTSQFNRAGGNAQGTYQSAKVTATAGYAYEVENGFPSGTPGEHARLNNQAGYMEARWTPAPRVNLEAGVRAEDNSSFGTRVVPRVGASYLARKGNSSWGDTRLRAFYGQGIVEPRLDQSFGNDPCFPGNPNLKPERSRTANAGVEQLLDSNHLRISADYFYTDLYDVISFAFLPPTMACTFGTGTFFNTDRAIARGTHAVAEYKINRHLLLSGNYTYDNSRVLQAPNAFDPSQQPGNHLFHRPVNSGNIAMNLAVGRFNGNLAGYFTGIRTDSDFMGLGLTHAPGYAWFNLACSYQMVSRASLFIRVNNLFDKQYQTVLGYPALGREVLGGLRLRLGGEK
jgi:outer membrane cobalamin receptor